MARIIYGGAAVGDFERIIEFTLQSSPDSGSRALERIRTAIEILAAHPLIGRRVDGDLRELVISEGATGYVALYRFDLARDLVRILRIRHQREAGYRP